MRPIPNCRVVFGSQIKTRHKTLFCLCAICGQQKGEEVKPDSILCRRPAYGVKCCVLFPAVICGRDCISVIHVRVLKCSVANTSKRPKSISFPVAGADVSAGRRQRWNAISFQDVLLCVTSHSSRFPFPKTSSPQMRLVRLLGVGSQFAQDEFLYYPAQFALCGIHGKLPKDNSRSAVRIRIVSVQ